jgi:hypothetical protein
LTLDQVRAFDLPSTPLKPTEKRADKWRERMGHEQTEIDALAALRPADLAAIARAAVAPFHDFTLAARCAAARAAWLAAAEARIADHPALAAAHDEIAEAYADLEAAQAALGELRAETHARLVAELGIGDAVIRAPAAVIQATSQTPLLSTEDDFAAASRRLIAEKQYETGADPPGADRKAAR